MKRGFAVGARLAVTLALLGVNGAASAQGPDEAADEPADEPADAGGRGDPGDPDALALEGGDDAREASVSFDVHLTVGWYAAAGGGLRADLPVVREGLIDVVEDDVRIGLGADVLWYWSQDDQIAFYPHAVLQWNFYLDERWSVFPEVGAVLMFPRPHFWRTFIAPMVSLGARYHFSDRNAFLVRVSWPHGLQLGLTF